MSGRQLGVNPRRGPAVGCPLTTLGVRDPVRLDNGEQRRKVDAVAGWHQVGPIDVANEVLVWVAPLLDGLVAVDDRPHHRRSGIGWWLHRDQLILCVVLSHGPQCHLERGGLAVQVSQLLVDRDGEVDNPAGRWGRRWRRCRCGRWRKGWRWVLDYKQRRG